MCLADGVGVLRCGGVDGVDVRVRSCHGSSTDPPKRCVDVIRRFYNTSFTTHLSTTAKDTLAVNSIRSLQLERLSVDATGSTVDGEQGICIVLMLR